MRFSGLETAKRVVILAGATVFVIGAILILARENRSATDPHNIPPALVWLGLAAAAGLWTIYFLI